MTNDAEHAFLLVSVRLYGCEANAEEMAVRVYA